MLKEKIKTYILRNHNIFYLIFHKNKVFEEIKTQFDFVLLVLILAFSNTPSLSMYFEKIYTYT